jgi:hypothetical protein
MSRYSTHIEILQLATGLLELRHSGPGSFGVRKGILHHLREVGVSHEFRELAVLAGLTTSSGCYRNPPPIRHASHIAARLTDDESEEARELKSLWNKGVD